jgi:hypothetical protein
MNARSHSLNDVIISLYNTSFVAKIKQNLAHTLCCLFLSFSILSLSLSLSLILTPFSQRRWYTDEPMEEELIFLVKNFHVEDSNNSYMPYIC